jgi:hypothetical protein
MFALRKVKLYCPYGYTLHACVLSQINQKKFGYARKEREIFHLYTFHTGIR